MEKITNLAVQQGFVILLNCFVVIVVSALITTSGLVNHSHFFFFLSLGCQLKKGCSNFKDLWNRFDLFFSFFFFFSENPNSTSKQKQTKTKTNLVDPNGSNFVSPH